MRLFFSAPLGHGRRGGVSFSDRELAGNYRQKNPLRRMTDEENAFALVDAYAKIERLPEAQRAKAIDAVESAAAYREQIKRRESTDRRAWPWVLLAFAILCVIGAIAGH